jgi:inosine/xanthosine triphosphate pyrophosphatase family protein
MVQVPANAQEGGRKKKPWKKSGSSYNPYLEKKAKNKPSARMARADKKELHKQKKAARKQMRRSKRRLNKR